MSGSGSKRGVAASGIVAAAVIVMALFACSARMAGAARAARAGQPATVTTAHATAQGAHMAPRFRLWGHPLGTSRDAVPFGILAAAGLVVAMALLGASRSAAAGRGPGVALPLAAVRGPPAGIA